MPIWRSQNRIRTQWLGLMCLVNILFALFTYFGRSDEAYQILIKHTVPDWLWPLLLLVTTAAIIVGWSIAGGLAGFMLWGAQDYAIIVTIERGTGLSSAGWILPALMVGVHALIFWEVGTGLDEHTERRYRGMS